MAKKAGKVTKKVGKVIKKSEQINIVQDIASKMDNAFGSGSVLIPDRDTILCKVDDWVTTRNFMIDSALTSGLANKPIIPFGRLTEVAGKNKSGKTTLMGHIMAETQSRGGIAAIADTENALDLSYFEKLGVDLSRLIIIPTLTVEDVFTKFSKFIDIVRENQNNKQLIVLGWDSVGATSTKKELEADADDQFYAECAKVVSKNLRRIINQISKEKINLMFNNHVYYKMQISYGDNLETYGGERIKFFSTLRIRLTGSTPITVGSDEDKVEIGKFVKIKIIKNKMSPHLRTVTVPCIGGHGFSNDYAIMEQAKKQKLIKVAKAWKYWTTLSGEEISFKNWNEYLDKVVVHSEYGDLVAQVIATYNKKFEKYVK
jgi:recombination protein RecA